MSVRKRLEKKKTEPVDVDALIEKGAKVKEDMHLEDTKWSYINVRISNKMLDDVDSAVSNRVGITRTGWILEALYEKLKKEKEDG